MENEKEKLREKALLTIRSDGASLADQAEAFIITDNASLQEANEFFQICKQMRDKIHKMMDPIREERHKHWKDTIAEIDLDEKPLIKAQGIIKPKIIAYKQKIVDAIRKKEEAARAKIEAERKKQEKLLEDAAALEKAGEKEEADQTFEEAEKIEKKVESTIQKMAHTPAPPKLEGTTIRKIPQWKLINLADVPREYLMLDTVKIGAMVRASKGTVKIPGIEVYFKSV